MGSGGVLAQLSESRQLLPLEQLQQGDIRAQMGEQRWPRLLDPNATFRASRANLRRGAYV